MKCDHCSCYLLLDWQFCPQCGSGVRIDGEGAQKCRGASKFPQAFDSLAYRFGMHVAEQPWFYATFCQYVQILRHDPTQLVYFRAALVDVYYRFVGPNPPVATNEAFWCAISLTTDRYFKRLAEIHSWIPAQEDFIVERWYDFIDLAFLIHEETTSLQLKDIEDWIATLDRMQTLDSGPLAACKLCEAKCVFGEDVAF